MKLTKTHKIIGSVVIAAGLGYFLWDGYRKRWQLFENFGESRFAGISEKFSNLAIQVADTNHGIEAGDTINVEHSGAARKGEVKVLEVVEKDVHGKPWLVLDWPTNATDKISGRFKLVKKA